MVNDQKKTIHHSISQSPENVEESWSSTPPSGPRRVVQRSTANSVTKKRSAAAPAAANDEGSDEEDEARLKRLRNLPWPPKSVPSEAGNDEKPAGQVLPNMSNFAQEFGDDEQFQSTIVSQSSTGSPPPVEKDPDAEVVALSPTTLMATNRYICEVCHKGFQRDQNPQLHRRGHNLPWKLKQRPNTQVKRRVYVCPEPNCVHHDPSRALGDLTGIKKHFCSKHGEKKWKCDRCSKHYAVQSDWKAHTKICGTREYCCDCGTIFSRLVAISCTMKRCINVQSFLLLKDSFVTHRAFCDALTEENYKTNQNISSTGGMLQSHAQELTSQTSFSSGGGSNSFPMAIGSCYTSATASLQKAAEMGAKISDNSITPILLRGSTAATNNSSIVGDISQTGFLHSSLSMHSENGQAGDLFRQVSIGGGEKMT
uniref:C2H2-type domain-containing protein n=1 Tax=Fagus sylvatica TaxID=28930 RepID=A0A2N9FUW0_FAGSY